MAVKIKQIVSVSGAKVGSLEAPSKLVVLDEGGNLWEHKNSPDDGDADVFFWEPIAGPESNIPSVNVDREDFQKAKEHIRETIDEAVSQETKPADKLSPEEIVQRFADEHGIMFDNAGECGLGRPCVGFCDNGSWIDYNPINHADDYEHIKELYDERHRKCLPADAYHKHDCFAVLVDDDDYGEAIKQLASWVEKIEAIGEVQVVDYSSGAVGLQAALSGSKGKCVVWK